MRILNMIGPLPDGCFVLHNPVRKIHSDPFVPQVSITLVSSVGLKNVPELASDTHLLSVLLARFFKIDF